MNDVNLKFNKYCEKLRNGNLEEILISLAAYQEARKSVNRKILQEENMKMEKCYV